MQAEEHLAQERPSGSLRLRLRQAAQDGPNLFNTMASEGKTIETPNIHHPEPCLRPLDCMIPTPLAA